MKKIFSLLVGIYLLSSCVNHQGAISSSTVCTPIQYQDIAIGVAQRQEFLGIGKDIQDALIFEAKRMLYKNRPLKANENYINFSVDTKKTFFFLYYQTKVTVTADVVKTISDTTLTVFSDNYNKKLNYNAPNPVFSLGDSITILGVGDGIILSINPFKKITYAYYTPLDKLLTTQISFKHTFSKCKTYKTWNLYQPINYKSSKYSISKPRGVILGFGLKHLLVKNALGFTEIVPYKKIISE